MFLGDSTPYSTDTLFLRHIDLLDYLAPALWRNLVVFTSGDTIVRAFDRDTGKIVWQKELPFPTSSAPTIAGDRIYFGMRGDEYGMGTLFQSGEKPKLVCLSARD